MRRIIIVALLFFSYFHLLAIESMPTDSIKALKLEHKKGKHAPILIKKGFKTEIKSEGKLYKGTIDSISETDIFINNSKINISKISRIKVKNNRYLANNMVIGMISTILGFVLITSAAFVGLYFSDAGLWELVIIITSINLLAYRTISAILFGIGALTSILIMEWRTAEKWNITSTNTIN